MTQSVSFHFTSPQFVFNSGYVAFFKGARLRSDGEISTGEITGGVVDGVLVVVGLSIPWMTATLERPSMATLCCSELPDTIRYTWCRFVIGG